MLHRIRLAMQTKSFDKMGGTVEVDETFIGAKARNMHHSKKQRVLKGKKGGLSGKMAVMGILQRAEESGHSIIRLRVVEHVKRGHLLPHVKENVEAGANVHTDALPSYYPLKDEFAHKVIDHANKYVDGIVHTNGMENFWSLLKRTLGGTYVSVMPFHLFRYLDEQAYRFNSRKEKDADRFADMTKRVTGRRIMYKDLIGHTNEVGQTA
jgi:hypothetical protein